MGVAVTLALVSLAWGADKGTQFAFFDIDPNVLDESFFKVPLRPGRVVAFLSVAIVGYTMATYLWVPIRRVLGWLMLPLGQAALYSYIVHFFLILLVFNLSPLFASLPWEPSQEVFTPALQILTVLLLWALVLSMKNQGITQFSVPLLNLVIVVVLAALAGVVASILPSRRAAKLNILRAIVSE